VHNMLEVIEATASPFAIEPGLKTPEEAIAFAKSITRARVDDRIASCVGYTIKSTDWCDDELRLFLDNGKTLHFGCAEDAVDLTIEVGMRHNVGDQPRPQDVVLIRLGRKEIHWKRGDLIRALEGQTFRLIRASQSGFFFYATGVDILTIHVLMNRRTGRPFLFWQPTD
jgi:hypothetical protein